MIIVTSVIKNSADIIETMIRANALVADRFVIVDHASTDRTRDILEALQHEEFPIDILTDDSESHYQSRRMEGAISYAIENYSPDFIFPLDDDEIICPNDDSIAPEDIKAKIEELPQDMAYYIRWRNYMPTDADDAGEICVAKREVCCLDDEPEMTRKVFFPARLAKGNDFKLGAGNHFISSGISAGINLLDLRLAHFPVRSPEQIAQKAVVGWLNSLTMPDLAEETSIHWQRMYAAVKKIGLPTMEMMQQMCLLYREYPNDMEHLNIIVKPLALPTGCFEMKYTSKNEINVLAGICENAERIARSYADLLRQGER